MLESKHLSLNKMPPVQISFSNAISWKNSFVFISTPIYLKFIPKGLTNNNWRQQFNTGSGNDLVLTRQQIITSTNG